jgi:Fic family protein
MIHYALPRHWMRYDFAAVAQALVDAKAAVLALRNMPTRRDWVEHLQQMELKREVAGTSRIEGADFTENELNEALKESPETLLTRSQRQAHAAAQTYRFIAQLPADRPLDRDLILDIHRRIVTGADDDHCSPGVLRGPDQNVNFGVPRHRGAEGGGEECRRAFDGLCAALAGEMREHDPFVRAMALHYHFASMHPFMDGNGRTARALEALLLQQAGLRDTCFIALSNYYYEEKNAYLQALAESRARDHDLTPFLAFGLKGLTLQVGRVLAEIKTQAQKAVFRNLMYDLFGRLKTPRKRVLAERQLEILRLLLKQDAMDIREAYDQVKGHYETLHHSTGAFVRDIFGLEELGALKLPPHAPFDVITLNLDWPAQITESGFMEKIKNMPKAKMSRLRL